MKTKTTASETSGLGGPRLSSFRPAAIIALWMTAVLGGFAMMASYEFSAGDDSGAENHAGPGQFPTSNLN